MDNLIRVYDNVIDNEYCHELMDKFENNEQLHQKFDSDGMVFTQINIQKVGWFDDNNILKKVFTANVEKYKNDCEVSEQQMPLTCVLEPVRMKRYLPNNYDEFRPHVDVNQKANCTRFLVMFLYLADNKKGKTTLISLLGQKKARLYALNLKKKILRKLEKHGKKARELINTIDFIFERKF